MPFYSLYLLHLFTLSIYSLHLFTPSIYSLHLFTPSISKEFLCDMREKERKRRKRTYVLAMREDRPNLPSVLWVVKYLGRRERAFKQMEEIDNMKVFSRERTDKKVPLSPPKQHLGYISRESMHQGSAPLIHSQYFSTPNSASTSTSTSTPLYTSIPSSPPNSTAPPSYSPAPFSLPVLSICRFIWEQKNIKDVHALEKIGMKVLGEKKIHSLVLQDTVITGPICMHLQNIRPQSLVLLRATIGRGIQYPTHRCCFIFRELSCVQMDISTVYKIFLTECFIGIHTLILREVACHGVDLSKLLHNKYGKVKVFVADRCTQINTGSIPRAFPFLRVLSLCDNKSSSPPTPLLLKSINRQIYNLWVSKSVYLLGGQEKHSLREKFSSHANNTAETFRNNTAKIFRSPKKGISLQRVYVEEKGEKLFGVEQDWKRRKMYITLSSKIFAEIDTWEVERIIDRWMEGVFRREGSKAQKESVHKENVQKEAEHLLPSTQLLPTSTSYPLSSLPIAIEIRVDAERQEKILWETDGAEKWRKGLLSLFNGVEGVAAGAESICVFLPFECFIDQSILPVCHPLFTRPRRAVHVDYIGSNKKVPKRAVRHKSSRQRDINQSSRKNSSASTYRYIHRHSHRCTAAEMVLDRRVTDLFCPECKEDVHRAQQRINIVRVSPSASFCSPPPSPWGQCVQGVWSGESDEDTSASPPSAIYSLFLRSIEVLCSIGVVYIGMVCLYVVADKAEGLIPR